MRIHVTVTQEDIMKGIPNRVACCPVALSLRRQVKSYKNPEVGKSVVLFESIGVGAFVETDLPQEVIQFIKDFDNDKEVFPFDFILNIGELRNV